MPRPAALQPYVDPEFKEEQSGRGQGGSPEEQEGPQEEAREWLQALHAAAKDPANFARSQAFFHLLKLANSGRKADRTVKMTNQARRFIGQVWSWTAQEGGGAEAEEEGPDQSLIAHTCQILYNHCLNSLLLSALDATPGLAGMQQDAVVIRILDADNMQLALLTCCVEVVVYGYGAPSALFPAATLHLGRQRHMLELWAAAGWVRECLQDPGQEHVPVAPACLLAYLGAVRARVEEELAWSINSTLFSAMVKYGDYADHQSAAEQERRSTLPHEEWHMRLAGQESEEPLLLASFLRSVANQAMARMRAVCGLLAAQHPKLQTPAFAASACSLLDLALCNHLDLLNGRHLSVLVACAAYQAARTWGVDPRLRSLMHLLVANLPEHDESVFAGALGSAGQPEGEELPAAKALRAFYNDHWLEAMESFSETLSDLAGEQQGEEAGQVRRSLSAASSQSSQEAGPGSQGSAGGLKPNGQRDKRPLGRVDANVRQMR